MAKFNFTELHSSIKTPHSKHIPPHPLPHKLDFCEVTSYKYGSTFEGPPPCQSTKWALPNGSTIVKKPRVSTSCDGTVKCAKRLAGIKMASNATSCQRLTCGSFKCSTKIPPPSSTSTRRTSWRVSVSRCKRYWRSFIRLNTAFC